VKRPLSLARFVCLGFLICAAGALKASPRCRRNLPRRRPRRAPKGYGQVRPPIRAAKVVLVGRDGRRVPMSEVVPRDAQSRLTFIFHQVRLRLPDALEHAKRSCGKRMRRRRTRCAWSHHHRSGVRHAEKLRRTRSITRRAPAGSFYNRRARASRRGSPRLRRLHPGPRETQAITFLRRAYGDEWTRSREP